MGIRKLARAGIQRPTIFKMDSITQLFVVCLGLVVILQSGYEVSAMKCYSCMGKGCGDEFNKDADGVTVVDCPNGACLKTKTGDTVVRVCSPVPALAADEECQETEYQGQSAEGCLCKSNLCNAASSPSVSIVTTVAMVCTVAVWKVFFGDN